MGSYIYEMEDDLCQIRETDTLPGTSISWELQSFLPALQGSEHTVGACIVSEDNKILSMGYNGLPSCDDEFPWDKIDEDPYIENISM